MNSLSSLRKWAEGKWFPLSIWALSISLAHVLIDFHIGLFGETSKNMSMLEALNVATTAGIYGFWAWAIAGARNKEVPAISTALVFALVQSALINGLVAFFAAPPPSSAYPFQDLTHLGSLAAGSMAGLGLWSLRSKSSRAGSRLPFISAFVIIGLSLATSGLVFFQRG